MQTHNACMQCVRYTPLAAEPLLKFDFIGAHQASINSHATAAQDLGIRNSAAYI